MKRTCNELGVCQSRGCDGCHYPFYPGGQPAWRWGDWRERVAADPSIGSVATRPDGRRVTLQESPAKAINHMRNAIQMVEGGEASRAVQNIERQRASG